LSSNNTGQAKFFLTESTWTLFFSNCICKCCSCFYQVPRTPAICCFIYQRLGVMHYEVPFLLVILLELATFSTITKWLKVLRWRERS